MRQRARLQRQLEISKLVTKLQLDRDKLDRTSRIVSRTQGTVTQILTAADEYVREGAPVVLLSSPKETIPGPDFDGPYECIVFVPAGEGKKIDVGNFVEVMPATIKREEHGIVNNIVGFAPDLTMEDAWQAAKLAGLDDDIRRLPMGMHTLVGKGGSNLSGGQRRRLLIARAIVRRPRILMFDEATSALDNLTQSIVTESITRVVIAHRLTTVIDADRLYVVKQGQIVQCGDYHQLLEDPVRSRSWCTGNRSEPAETGRLTMPPAGSESIS